jgi:HEAT repeat protein
LSGAQKVSAAFEGQTLDHFLTLMNRDRFMPVRREALRICVKRSPQEALVELRTALLDTHASMREEARYHLQKIGTIDVAAFYRQSLLTASQNDLYSAISGLGETGSTPDDRLIVSYTSHGAAKIRRAALKAVARLNLRDHLIIFIEALKDDVPHVSRQATKALADGTSSINGERVWEIFLAAAHDHVKRNAFSLLEKLGKWESIYYLLRTIRDSDQAVAGMSHFSIQRWLARFNRSFSAPTREQLLRLSSALEESGNLLSETTKERLQFSLKGF